MCLADCIVTEIFGRLLGRCRLMLRLNRGSSLIVVLTEDEANDYCTASVAMNNRRRKVVGVDERWWWWNVEKKKRKRKNCWETTVLNTVWWRSQESTLNVLDSRCSRMRLPQLSSLRVIKHPKSGATRTRTSKAFVTILQHDRDYATNGNHNAYK